MSLNQGHLDDPSSLLAAIVASSQDAILSESLDGIVTSWNAAAQRIFGYSAAEMIGRPISRLFPEAQADDFHAILATVRRGERIDHYETKRKTKSGRLIDVSLTISPIHDARGRIVGASKIARDITERKRAEARFEAHAATTRILSEVSPKQAGTEAVLRELCRRFDWRVGGLWLAGHDRTSLALDQVWDEGGPGPPLHLSEGKARTLRPGQGLSGRAWASASVLFEGPGPGEPSAPGDGDPQRSSRPFAVAFPMVFERDAIGVMEFAGDRDRSQEPGIGEFLLTIGRQVAQFLERKRAEEALRASQERIDLISDCGILNICLFADDGRVLDANDSFLELVGFSRAELERGIVRWDCLTPPEGRERARLALEMLRETGRIPPHEAEYQRPDGSRFWGLFGGAAYDDRDQGVGFVIDITDRKRAERDREHLLARLSEADRLKDEFLAMLSHELRNPLAAIGTAVELLEAAPDNPDHRLWAMEVLDRQVRMLGHLLDELLDASRVTQGKIALKKRVIDASEIIRNAVETVTDLLDDREHSLEVSLDRGLLVEADETRLEQIVVNLLSNALKYTDSGGLIRVEARREGPEVVCAVRDSGIGIPPEKLPSMFELFVQGDRSVSRTEGGLGIGLTLVKSLTEMHSGVVQAHSEGPGKGSEFVIRLPAAKDD
jgi:PAS domain S-box-containing protein